MVAAQMSPKAVVLDSTVAREISKNDFTTGMMNKWRSIKDGIGPRRFAKLKEFLDSEIRSRAMTSQGAATIIQSMLHAGKDEAVKALSQLVDSGRFRSLKILTAPHTRYLDFNRAIACREISPEFSENQVFQWNGDLSVSQENSCVSGGYVNSGDRAGFDSKDFPIQAPLIYLQGDDDQITNAAQSNYHFRMQKNSDRTIVRFPSIGHGVLSHQMNDACREKFWLAVSENRSSARRAFETCFDSSNRSRNESPIENRRAQQ